MFLSDQSAVYHRDGKSVDMGGGTNTLPRRQTLKRLESDEKKKVEDISGFQE